MKRSSTNVADTASFHLVIISPSLITGSQFLAPHIPICGASQVVLVAKNSPVNAGDIRDGGSTPGLGRSSGGGHGSPLQYSCLENPMDRGAWRATVLSVTKSWTRLT